VLGCQNSKFCFSEISSRLQKDINTFHVFVVFFENCIISGVMVSMLAMSLVDRGVSQATDFRIASQLSM
jgi:hypothetical protein